MNRKNIKLSSGNAFLSQEEVLEQFTNMIRKFAHNCVKNFEYYNNSLDYDDYFQIGSMKLLYVYEKYDFEKGYCFTTLLDSGLSNTMIDLARSFETNKRKITKTSMSYIDELFENEDDSKIMHTSLIYEEGNGKKPNLEKFLQENLTWEERLMLSAEFKVKIASSSAFQKSNIIYLIQALLEDSELPSKREIANIIGCSQPTVRARTKKAIRKLEDTIKEFYIRNNIDVSSVL